MFKLQFSTENEAFVDNFQTEVARILHEVAKKVAAGQTGGKAMDGNGNTVGQWSLKN